MGGSLFITDLILKPLPNRKWEVMCPFVVNTKTAGTLVVEAGFLFDGNSIPRALWWASTPADYIEAGCVHDWGYRGNLPRDVADKVYREILEGMGMGKVRRNARYRALRLFGGSSYKAPLRGVVVPDDHGDAKRLECVFDAEEDEVG